MGGSTGGGGGAYLALFLVTDLEKLNQKSQMSYYIIKIYYNFLITKACNTD